MHPSLTIQEKLKDLRVANGLTTEQLSKATGLSKSALNNYENDKEKDISLVSLTTLAKYYRVSTDYLLGMHDNVVYANTELSELHLSDDMIDLLKNSKINHRLLCEIATHKEFSNLMADIELFVDKLASMQIHNLNVWVDAAREEIINKYHPTEEDSTLRTLKSAHIIEDTYFSELVHNDIDTIMKDIRENHSKDSTSAPEQPELADIRKQLKEVADYEGNELNKNLILFCKLTQLNYSKLTEEEKRSLVGIVNKSSLLRTSSSNQRGKKKRK